MHCSSNSEDIGRARWPPARHANGLATRPRHTLCTSVRPSNDQTTLHRWIRSAILFYQFCPSVQCL